DNAAGEACPFWPGKPTTAHWGVPDPAAAQGTDLEKKAAFVQAVRFLKNRISTFINLPIMSLDSLALRNRLNAIGQMEGATKRQNA
ncbi:MAG TPA: arsenate reductase ArsC, partial [Alphaproteobacteria bacterium]|nr:arsenate reductase ArsC [Alphaproteobacteria bacterium]